MFALLFYNTKIMIDIRPMIGLAVTFRQGRNRPENASMLIGWLIAIAHAHRHQNLKDKNIIKYVNKAIKT